jgi:tripartite-type tricarboxylate transporter receptor subunit TctC
VNSFKEFVAYAKANPSTLNFASIGNGSSSHLTMELLKSKAGVTMQHVPFNGSPPAALSVANGETQALFAVASGIAPLVKAGKVKLLAVSSAQRFEQLPTLPALAETPALKGFEALAWNGLFTAKGTPPDVVAKINRDVNAALSRTDIKARFYVQGMQTAPRTPEAFAAMIAKDSQTWGALIEQLNIKLD